LLNRVIFGKGLLIMTNLRLAWIFVTVLLLWISFACGSSGRAVTSVTATSNPLVAKYTVHRVRPGVSVWVEFGTATSYGRQTSTITSTGGDLNILVAGMRAQTTYHMRAHLEEQGNAWTDEDHTFTTGAVPADPVVPQIEIARIPADPPGVVPAPGVELLSLVSTAGANIVENVVTDLQGNVIWYCPRIDLPIVPLANGHMLLNSGTDLLEVDLECNLIRDVSLNEVNQSLQTNGYSLPTLKEFHHDMLLLPNGHLIALANATKDFTDLSGYPGITAVLGDVLLDIDPNGNVAWAWSSFDHLDVNRHPYFGLPDWTHSNAIVYTPDGNLLLSIRHQSWVIKIDYANGTGSGDILWRLGREGDFTLLGGDPTEWFYAQHYPNLITTNGSQMILAIWDNGNYRTDASGLQCGGSSGPACYSRATLFQVDESTNLATLLWQDLPGYYSFWGGSVGILANGNVEFDMTTPTGGPSSQIMEVTQTDTPGIVWQMNISGANAYRGFRIASLYPGVTWNQ
jgi:arylsulfate sulfotransferase